MAPPTRLWGAHSPSTLAVARRKSSACIAFDLTVGEGGISRERERGVGDGEEERPTA